VTRPTLILLPGIMMPGHLRYARLIELVRGDVQPVVKELEVYREAAPPEGYSIAMEVDAIARLADDAGAARVHLLGYSGGGACALAFVATYPGRVISLALDEPACDFTEASLSQLRHVQQQWGQLPVDARMEMFMRDDLQPGVVLPERTGPPPTWMANRSEGIEALIGALLTADVDTTRYATSEGPVYVSWGSLSGDRYEESARAIQVLFRDVVAEEYEGRHHLDAPHQTEPERFAARLRELWARAA